MSSTRTSALELDAILAAQISMSGGGLGDGVRRFTELEVGDSLAGSALDGAITLRSTAGGSVAGTWHTLLDLDFSAQTAATFDTDGTVTIGGTTWTVANVANRYSGYAAMAVVPGSGLRTARADSAFYWQELTWPLLRWQLPAQVTNGVPLRVCAQSLAGADTGYSWRGSMVAVAAPRTTANDQFITGVARCSQGSPSGALQITAAAYRQSVLHAPASQPALFGGAGVLPDWTFDLYGIDFPHGVGVGRYHYATWGQSASGHRADPNRMTRFTWLPIGVETVIAAPSPAVAQSQNWGLYLMGSDNGAPQDFIRSIRVEACY